MKRTWMAVAAVLSATAICATGARADDPPVVVEAMRITYYVELGGMASARATELAALLKREFPKAQVELIDGTLRIQTNLDTLDAIEKVLHKERVVTPGVDAGVRKTVVVRGAASAPVEGGLERREKKAGKDAHPLVKVKVGELCEGCADCLAAALGKQFPKLKFVPGDGVVEVYGDADGQIAVEAWLADLHGNAKARFVFDGGDPKARPDIDELKKRLDEALRTGRRDESMKLSRALARAQGERAEEESRGKARMEIGPEALEALRERLELVRTRLQSVKDANERETLEGVRRRLEEAKEQLERVGDALAKGGGSGGGAGGQPRPAEPPVPAPPMPPAPPRRAELGGFQGHHTSFGGRESKEGRGPLAEFRERIHHLTQAAEHLNAAGYETLAKQAGDAAEQVKRQAAEVVKRIRAEEEARAAAMTKEHEARAARHEQERAEARKREDALRAAGMLAPPDSSELRSEELLDLLRALNRQMNAMREELKAFREQMGRDR